MLTVVKKNLKYLFANLKCNIKTSKSYKINFIIDTIFMFINNSSFLVFWWAIINANGGDANGIYLSDIMYLWGIPTISYGVAYFFFEGVSDINRLFINGTMDTYLLQPKHPLIGIMTSKCRFSAFGDFIYGVTMVALASNFDIIKILFSILIGIFGSSIYLSLEIIVRSLSVYLGDTESLAERYIYTMVIKFSTYPEKIYPKVLKFLLYGIVPAAYISFVPINLITEFNPLLLIIFIASITIFPIISILVFNNAVKHYESGNNMLLRE